MAYAFLAGALLSGFITLVFIRLSKRQQENQFKVIAHEVLRENSKEFLEPFDQKLKDYYNFINSTHNLDTKERQSIKEQINFMLQSAQKIEVETNQLSKALSSDVKFQGAWGELVLEKVLELSGLSEGKEFVTQNHLKKDEKGYRPDVIVNLPQNSHLIIDSKVSLRAYFNYINDENSKALVDLKNSLKSHIDQLAKKDYQLLEGVNVPDFVYLFIPVEGVYALILKEFPELIDESLKKNIILVSPVNLMANLKTVAALWRVDKQSKSAVEIAHKAGAMYDKFAGLTKDLESLQIHFKRVDATFQDIHKKLHTGRGNLIDRAEELKEYGARTSKELNH